jgi:cytochrome c553
MHASAQTATHPQTRRKPNAAGVLMLALAAPWAAMGEPAMPPAAIACKACHGAEGVSMAPDIPNLAGQKSAYIAAQLNAFRAGARKNELMNAMASQLAADEIQALATYWSALPAGGSGTASTPSTAIPSAVRLPEGFPKGFTEYQRTRSDDGKSVQAFFANGVALAAARTGAPLPDGSAIVGVTYDAAGGAVRSYSAMASQAGWGQDIPPLLRNGNWQYGLFTAEGTPRIGNLHARCLACHQPMGAKSNVFTLDALAARARQP